MAKGKVAEGNKAPSFALRSSDGGTVSLSDFKAKKRVVLYFYPKDDTPGCTVEACGFRDGIKAIEAEGAVVLGVSPDDTASHKKFVEKFNLPFLLLSDDEDKGTCKTYGVWVKKNMYGREYMGVQRATFVIGKDGTIEKIFQSVKPDGHTQEVLGFLRGSER